MTGMTDQLRSIGTSIRDHHVKQLRRRRLTFLGYAAATATCATVSILTIRMDVWPLIPTVALVLAISLGHWTHEAVRKVVDLEHQITEIDGHLKALDDTPAILNTITLADFMTHIMPRTAKPRRSQPGPDTQDTTT